MWGVPILLAGWRFLQIAATPEPRLCPKCSYKMVYPISKKKRRAGRKSEKRFHTVITWACMSCHRQYETIGESVFFTPRPEDSEEGAADHEAVHEG